MVAIFLLKRNVIFSLLFVFTLAFWGIVEPYYKEQVIAEQGEYSLLASASGYMAIMTMTYVIDYFIRRRARKSLQ
jgi:hypothetical protein